MVPLDLILRQKLAVAFNQHLGKVQMKQIQFLCSYPVKLDQSLNRGAPCSHQTKLLLQLFHF